MLVKDAGARTGEVGEWTCGHDFAPAVCGECHRIILLKYAELAAENSRLCAKLAELAQVARRKR